MKRALLLFGLLVIISGALISCNNNQAVEDKMSTTAIADENGVTHFYQIETLADIKPEKTTLVEIVTDKQGKAVTDKYGKYVTVSNKAINEQKAKDTTHKSSSTKSKPTDKSGQKGNNKPSDNDSKDSNNVSFETSTEQNDKSHENTTNTSSENSINDSVPSTEEATDKDGWINRWY